MDAKIPIGHTACPHDCPSTCALEVELLDERRIGRVRGAKANSYTKGVVCAKVARYAERVHHKDRLLHPLRRKGPKGSGEFERISWDDALDLTAEAFLKAERQLGPEAVWPYYYAGTMGLVMRDGIERLRHAKRYSRFYSTICVGTSYPGFVAGTGKLHGPDSREMAKADVIVIWGGNPVATQVNVMTHATEARKRRGTKIIAVDVYRNGTVEQADVGLILRPGTDGALACAVMHCLFRDGKVDRAYLAKYADCPDELEAHLASRTPEWASAITGLSVAEIESFAVLLGDHPRTYFRLGFGFTRSRNGAHAMHSVLSVATVMGAWQHEGGGAMHSQAGIYHWDKTLIEGLDRRDTSIRAIDQSRIGPALVGDAYDLRGGPPVTAMLIQNTNPLEVAPEQRKVRQGFMRDDLFVCVHEQVMTETAKLADIVLPATMFLEHDDLYQASGHSHVQLGPKLIEPPGECRSNHDVIVEIAKRVGAEHPGFAMSPRELIDHTLQASGHGTLTELEAGRWKDVQPSFEESHYLAGFGWPDGKFRFKPQWTSIPVRNDGPKGRYAELPALPDHWDVTENADEAHPFRLVTAPARAYLNSSFNETETSREKHGRPSAMMHPEDLAGLGIKDGDAIRMGNTRGEIGLWAKAFAGVQPGVAVIEGIAPNAHFVGGEGINTLTGADQAAPYGGAPFHDNKVWVRKA
ncbi:MAG: molybdopterin oxidoreductase family protein [Hyphomicrobiaceae bacterium]